MAIKIKFDANNIPEIPTMILSKRNGDKIGKINSYGVVIKDDLSNPCEIVFSVKKYIDGKLSTIWKYITDFKLLYCVEWNAWFEITTEISEEDDTTKNVYCTELSQAELSQVMLFNIEINTDIDISREDYINPTVLYNPTKPSESLLNRIMEKVPHYKILHVDDSIKNIQRTFSFNDISLYDAFKEIEEEIGCLFRFNSSSDNNGKIIRGISVYDLETNCLKCGYRGEYKDTCPKCGNINLTEGYGEDTTVFISADELANNIQLTTDTGAVKNCFKLEAGDDLMTATIKNCNPNGSDYIWYITDDMKKDMSNELISKLNDYDESYHVYQNDYEYYLNLNTISLYNQLVNKYKDFNKDISKINSPVVGYPSLMQTYYNTIDFYMYLKSELMPNIDIPDTTAAEQLALLNSSNLSHVAVTNINNISLATADNVVLGMAKAIIDDRYKISILSSSFVKQNDIYIWSGKFEVKNYFDEEDIASNTKDIAIIIDDNYKLYIEQRLKKVLHQKEIKDLSVVGLFSKSIKDFELEIKKYCLDSLIGFRDAGQSCIDVLIEQGISVFETWGDKTPNLYEEIYKPYYEKIKFLESEIAVREKEIKIIIGEKDNNNITIVQGLQDNIESLIEETQKALDFQNYIGDELWVEFISYRREDKYLNDNYISDGLNNAELFKQALEFIEIAEKEIYKSAELQHSITASLKNLFIIKKFRPLVNSFCVGNWIRIKIDDVIYKLRLIKYEIDFDNIENMSVEFSDVFKSSDGITDQQSIISNSIQMASSYNSTQRQAEQGAKSQSILQDWSKNGFNTSENKIINGTDGQSQLWDEHGMLFKRFNVETKTYDDIQMRIINSSLVITDDNWNTSKTAVGLFKYINIETGEIEETYGINGETIVGKLLVGNGLKIYNDFGNMLFDENGLTIFNDKNIIKINPNSNSIFTISNQLGNIISFDENGNGLFNGNITANSGSIGGWNITQHDLFAQFSTQSLGFSKIPLLDENGNPVYTSRLVFDENGNPVYEKNEQGQIIYSTEYVYDENDNLVYKKDLYGNILYTTEYVYVEQYNENGDLTKEILYENIYDEEGQIIQQIPVTKNVPIPETKSIPVQAVEKIPVMKYVQVTLDNYYNNYTVLTSTGDIAMSIGVTEKDERGLPSVSSGTIKMYNNGNFDSKFLTLKNNQDDEDEYEPILTFEKKSNNNIESAFIKEIFISKALNYNEWQDYDSTVPALLFSFKANSENEIYSVIVDKNGVYPYGNNISYCGTPVHEWTNIHATNIDISKKTTIANVLYMKDDRSRKRLIMSLYHDGNANKGSNLIISGYGNTYIGSGFSQEKLYKNNPNGDDKNLYLASDENIYFYSNCKNFSKRKGIIIDSLLNFKPMVNGVGNLGEATSRWNNIYSMHSVSVLSDERMKTNMKSIENAKELIMNLKPLQYMYTTRNSDRIHYGFSSQQLKDTLDKIGIYDCGAWTVDINQNGILKGHTIANAEEDEKLYGIRYEELIAPIVSVLQDIESRLIKIEKQMKIT